MQNAFDMADLNLYRGSPRQIKYWIKRCLQAGLVPFVQGSPGIGKSAMIRGIADEFNLQLIDDRISTNGPEHYTGLPDVSSNKAVYKPFDTFPLEGDPLPAGKDGWLYFADEFNSGLPSTLVAAYKFFLEREVGQKKLHEKVYIVAAGNRMEDRAIVNHLGTALQRRFVWLEMFLDGNIDSHFNDFMHDVAYANIWHSKLIAYLTFNKGSLNKFDPEHTEKTFPCPGTWDFVNKLIEGDPTIPVEDMPLYAGAVGASEAVDFVNFCQITNIPQLIQVTSDPLNARIPTDKAEQYMTIAMLINEANDTNLGDIGDYVERFGLEFRIVFWKSIQVTKPAFRRNPAFRRAQTSLARYLYE